MLNLRLPVRARRSRATSDAWRNPRAELALDIFGRARLGHIPLTSLRHWVGGGLARNRCHLPSGLPPRENQKVGIGSRFRLTRQLTVP